VRLFAASHGYVAGEQLRDFVFIDDVVKVNLWFYDHPEISGIYNVGTGRAQTFNDVAVATINASRERTASLAELQGDGSIEYVAFPSALQGKYQAYTEADLTQLRGAGYDAPFASVEEGVRHYVEWLKKHV
jgi:ADP-L-glycero-D-manno-heptose 6-epimerase